MPIYHSHFSLEMLENFRVVGPLFWPVIFTGQKRAEYSASGPFTRSRLDTLTGATTLQQRITVRFFRSASIRNPF
jgi:hypothetical protein